jgi:hypothetical protein
MATQITELELMSRVAVHPLVTAYRKAVQLMHKRMTERYGADYAAEVTQEEIMESGAVLDRRMTELDRNRFESLMRGAASVRKSVRSSILAQ